MTYEPDVFSRRRVDGPICELVMAIRCDLQCQSVAGNVRVAPGSAARPTSPAAQPPLERAVGTKLGCRGEDRPCIRVIREPVHVIAAAESVTRASHQSGTHHVRPGIELAVTEIE